MSNKVVAPDLIGPLEAYELEVWRSMFLAASPHTAESCGLNLIGLNSGLIAMASKADVLAINRVMGLGFNGSISESFIETIIALYRDAGVKRFFIPVAPTAQSDVLSEKLRALGFKHHNNWVKLYRDSEAPPDVKTDLKVERLPKRQAGVFAGIVTDAFGWPEPTKAWMAETVGRPGWSHYAAIDGDVPVAVAAMFIWNNAGWLGMAATRPDYRGRGAQSALIARRILDAAAQGCRHLSLETPEDTAEKKAPSYHNVIRFGFREVYRRPNYLMTL